MVDYNTLSQIAQMIMQKQGNDYTYPINYSYMNPNDIAYLQAYGMAQDPNKQLYNILLDRMNNFEIPKYQEWLQQRRKN